MDSHNILSLLGLALRGGNLAVGEEPVEAVARARDARVLLLAEDAADNTLRRVRHFAEAGDCLWLRIPYTKEELGQAVGRTSLAIAAVTDASMALAMLRSLPEPGKYQASIDALEEKSRKLQKRRQEAKAHQRNVRKGKK